jgi:hypothetical protein
VDYHLSPELAPGEVVVLRRTSRAFDDAAAVRCEADRLGQALYELGRAGRSLLIDARQAPYGTDSRLGPEFALLRNVIRRDFEATAVLVRTKVGLLQATRLSNEDGLGRVERCFDDEEVALAYLRQLGPGASRDGL